MFFLPNHAHEIHLFPPLDNHYTKILGLLLYWILSLQERFTLTAIISPKTTCDIFATKVLVHGEPISTIFRSTYIDIIFSY